MYIFTLDNNNDTTLPIYVPHIWFLGPNGRMIIFLSLRFFLGHHICPSHTWPLRWTGKPKAGPTMGRSGNQNNDTAQQYNTNMPHATMQQYRLSVVPNLNAQGFLFSNHAKHRPATNHGFWKGGGGGLAEPKRHMGGISARRLGRTPPNNTQPSPT